MLIGQVLRQARLKAGITQSHLAHTMRLPIFTLNRVEAGTRSFDENWLPLLPIEIRKAVSKVLEKEYRAKLSNLQELRKNRFLRSAPL